MLFLIDKFILLIRNTVRIILTVLSSMWNFSAHQKPKSLGLTEKEINKLLLQTMLFCFVFQYMLVFTDTEINVLHLSSILSLQELYFSVHVNYLKFRIADYNGFLRV